MKKMMMSAKEMAKMEKESMSEHKKESKSYKPVGKKISTDTGYMRVMKKK